MNHNVSPLTNSSSSSFVKKTILDDPYAYITKMDPLLRHEYYYILNKIDKGWITERDIELVRFLFVHRWLTLSQIGKLFFLDSEREATVRNRTRKLIKYGLIRSVQWTSHSNTKENKPSLYEIGSSGADILKYKFGVFLGHRDPRNPKPTTMLFRMRYIATNELYAQMKENFDLTFFEFHPVHELKEEKQVPTAQYVLRNPKGIELSFILICYRDDEKWVKTLRHQAQFYKNHLETVNNTTLVILVSTEEKAILASKVLEQEKVLDKTWFVTDADLFNDELKINQSFFYFEEGRKIYYNLN